jgi:hypothetical protein
LTDVTANLGRDVICGCGLTSPVMASAMLISFRFMPFLDYKNIPQRLLALLGPSVNAPLTKQT